MSLKYEPASAGVGVREGAQVLEAEPRWIYARALLLRFRYQSPLIDKKTINRP